MTEERSKYIPWLIFIVSFLFISFFIKTSVTSANEASRIATIISLEEQGTFQLSQRYLYVKDENSVIFYTNDIIQRDNNYYSTKPPVFTWLAYQVKKVIPFDFPDNPRDFSLAYYFLTLTTVGLSYSLLLLFFYKSLVLVDLGLTKSLLLTMLLGSASLLLPFATVFNNHLPAALFLYLAFYYHLHKLKEVHKLKYIFLIGFFLALTAVVEITIGIIIWVIYLVYLVYTKNRTISYYLLGSLFWIALHFYLNWQIIGSFLPAYLNRNLYPQLIYDSQVDTFIGRIKYFFTMTILPSKGLIFYNPLLIYCFIALYRLIKKKRELSNEAKGLSVAFFASFIIWWLFTYDASGSSYGLRWAIPHLPLFFFFFARYLKDYQFKNQSPLFIISLISLMIALVGIINPWTLPINFYSYQLDFPLLANLLLLKSYLF